MATITETFNVTTNSQGTNQKRTEAQKNDEQQKIFSIIKNDFFFAREIGSKSSLRDFESKQSKAAIAEMLIFNRVSVKP